MNENSKQAQTKDGKTGRKASKSTPSSKDSSLWAERDFKAMPKPHGEETASASSSSYSYSSSYDQLDANSLLLNSASSHPYKEASGPSEKPSCENEQFKVVQMLSDPCTYSPDGVIGYVYTYTMRKRKRRIKRVALEKQPYQVVYVGAKAPGTAENKENKRNSAAQAKSARERINSVNRQMELLLQSKMEAERELREAEMNHFMERDDSLLNSRKSDYSSGSKDDTGI